MNEKDRLAANVADPHQYGDNERDEAYEAALDAQARCPECHDGYMRESISVSGEDDRRECPECGYWEYTDRS
jgi:hypothetical protein